MPLPVYVRQVGTEVEREDGDNTLRCPMRFFSPDVRTEFHELWLFDFATPILSGVVVANNVAGKLRFDAEFQLSRIYHALSWCHVISWFDVFINKHLSTILSVSPVFYYKPSSLLASFTFGIHCCLINPPISCNHLILWTDLYWR